MKKQVENNHTEEEKEIKENISENKEEEKEGVDHILQLIEEIKNQDNIPIMDIYSSNQSSLPHEKKKDAFQEF